MSERPEQLELQDPDLGRPAAAVATIDRLSGVVSGSIEGRIRSGRLAGLTMWQAIWVLSWPILVESFLQSLVGLVDTSLAAGISEAATDAVGAASYFLWFIGLVGVALGMGATALVSRSVGKGRIAVANAAVGQAVLAASVAGVVVGAMMILIAPVIAGWLNLEGEAEQSAISYLRIVSLGVPGITILSSGIAACRGAGDALRPLMTMVVVNAVNVGVSFALAGVDVSMTSRLPDGSLTTRVLIENPSPYDFGINGVAIGTLVAWLVGAVLMLGLLARGTHGVRLRLARLKPHWHTMRRLIRIGLPNFFETLGMWFGNFLTVLMVGWMATEGLLGAHVVGIRIEAFSFLPGFAMSLAAATLAGQYLGAGSPRLARLAILRCTAIAVLIMFSFSLAFIFIPEKIVGIFSQQPVHLDLTPKLLMTAGIVQIPFAITIVLRGAMRGAGDTRVVMCITWFSTYGVRLPLAWLCCGVDFPLPGGTVISNPAPLQTLGVEPLHGLWIGLCSEIFVRCALFLTRFLQGGWARIDV